MPGALALVLVAGAMLFAACRPPYVCSSDDDCDSASYCLLPSGGHEGLCQPRSERPADASPDDDKPHDGDAGPDDAGSVAVKIVDFTASAQTALYGTGVTLSWITHHAQSCALSSTGGAAESVPTRVVSHVVTVTRDESFTLSCAGADGSSDEATLDLQLQVEVVSFAGPSAVNDGDEVALEWEVRGATSCEITDDDTAEALYSFGADELPASSGTFTDTPGADRRYLLSCAGPGGSDGREISVDVWRVASFESTPGAVSASDRSVSLTWTTDHADPATCTLAGVNDGSPEPPPLVATVPDEEAFTLTCEGADGAELRAVLEVPVLIDAFSPRQGVVDFGERVILDVTSDPGARCSVDGEEVAGDSYETGALQGTRTFELTCELDGRVATAEATVKVRPEIASFTGALDDTSGSVAVALSWEVSANASSCVVRDQSGAEVDGASAPSSLTLPGGGPGLEEYTLECTSDPAGADPALVVTSSPVKVWWGNATEADLGALTGVPLVQGRLDLTDAPSTQLSELSDLVAVGGRLKLDLSPEVRSLTGLSNLRRVLGDLTITGNANLDSANLPALTRVDGNLQVNETSLQSFTGFSALSRVEGSLFSVTLNSALPCGEVEARYCALAQRPGTYVNAGNSGECTSTPSCP